jgi:beta-lactam-binding protein with PASTA domain
VVGRPADDARRRIEEAGFRPILETVADYRPAGTVVEQAPGGGSRAPTGSAVRLSVSDGTGEEPRIPDLAGLTVDEARAAIERLDLGLSLRVEEVPVDDIGQIGAVVAQEPSAGSPAQEGGTVTVEVGRQRGPEDEPSPTPTPTPSATPTLAPPGEQPTADPTVGPPLPGPGPDPTEAPTEAPTAEPTAEPGPSPSPEPASTGPPDGSPPGEHGGGEGDG